MGSRDNIHGIWFEKNMTISYHRQKKCTLDELATKVRQLKKEGKKIVHCHGTFDLLHLGHVRHFEAAKSNGDILVVTITANQFVNKGPGRPVFDEILREEMIAAISFVDIVCINYSADSVELLKLIQPNVYVKGQDYQNPEGDVTGKIVAEREAVESTGGEILFTSEVTFSSSELVNRHVNVFEPHIKEHLQSIRDVIGIDGIMEALEKLESMRVLIVGDAIIDEYHYTIPIGKPPKEDLIATRFQDSEVFAGGVFAAANHTASFCKEVEVISVLGRRDSREELIRNSLKSNVALSLLYRDEAITTQKRRYIDPSYMRKLFEVYYMDDDPLNEEQTQQLNRMIEEKAKDFDLVIVTDFGHGMISSSTIETLVKSAKFLAVNAQSNTANMGYNLITRYPSADYICIDAPEARLAMQDKKSPIVDVLQQKLAKQIDCSHVIITHGKFGCATYEKGQEVHTAPALASTVLDTVGAGDAFLAITSPLAAAGLSMKVVGFLGNVVGAIKVGIIGHRKSVEKVDFVKAVTALLK